MKTGLTRRTFLALTAGMIAAPAGVVGSEIMEIVGYTQDPSAVTGNLVVDKAGFDNSTNMYPVLRRVVS